jgi:hypothetical protein
MDRTMNARNRPLPGPVGRTSRRRLVAAVYGGYAALVVAGVLLGRLGWAWQSLFPVLFGVAGFAGFFVLRRAVQLAADLPDAALDERQRAVRDRAYVAAYRYVGALFFLAAVYGGLAWDSGLLWLPGDWVAIQAIVWGVFLLVTTLPSAALAWDEPEPVGEDR